MATKDQERSDEQVHFHRWSRVTNVEFKCIAFYKSKPCNALGVGEKELQRRRNEWNSYYELVKATDAYADYQEMKVGCSTHDLELIKEIVKRVSKRCFPSPTDNIGDSLYLHEKDVYMSTPDCPNPENPYIHYVTGGLE